MAEFVFKSLLENIESGPFILNINIESIKNLQDPVLATARKLVRKMINGFLKRASGSLSGNDFVLHVITGQALSSVEKRDATSDYPSADQCPPDEDTCKSRFNSCSGHGSCVAKKINNKNCYFCECSKQDFDDENNPLTNRGPVIWSGSKCQYKDISVPFHIILWTVVAILFVLLFTVGLLASAGYDAGNGSSSAYAHQKSD
jgi:hypothetical protein